MRQSRGGGNMGTLPETEKEKEMESSSTGTTREDERRSGTQATIRLSKHKTQTRRPRISLAVQWLGLHAFTAKGLGSIPGRGTKIPQAVWRGQEEDDLENVDQISVLCKSASRSLVLQEPVPGCGQPQRGGCE